MVPWSCMTLTALRAMSMPPAFAAIACGMLFYRPLVEGVNLCGFNCSARRSDVSRYSVELGLCPPGDKDSCAFPGKYSCYGATDCSASSVNNGVLIF